MHGDQPVVVGHEVAVPMVGDISEIRPNPDASRAGSAGGLLSDEGDSQLFKRGGVTSAADKSREMIF